MNVLGGGLWVAEYQHEVIATNRIRRRPCDYSVIFVSRRPFKPVVFQQDRRGRGRFHVLSRKDVVLVECLPVPQSEAVDGLLLSRRVVDDGEELDSIFWVFPHATPDLPGYLHVGHLAGWKRAPLLTPSREGLLVELDAQRFLQCGDGFVAKRFVCERW